MKISPFERRSIKDVLLQRGKRKYSADEVEAMADSLINLAMTAHQHQKPDIYGGSGVLVRR